MAEPRSKRIQVVLQLAERREQEAAQRLADYRATLSAEQAQLQQLEEYSRQYLEAFAARREGLRGSDLIAYSSFLQRLKTAQDEQKHKLERMEQVLAQRQAEWRQVYQRRRAIADLIQRWRSEEDQMLEKHLQKELDELAAQQLQRNSGE